MNDWLFWYHGSKKPISEAVQEAAQYYEEKNGIVPNVCHVHELDLGGTEQVGDIKVLGVSNILRDHLRIGVEDE